MDVSTSYKVKVDQLGEGKTIRKDWKGEEGQGKQLTCKRKKPTPPNQTILGQVAFLNMLQTPTSQTTEIRRLAQQSLSKWMDG